MKSKDFSFVFDERIRQILERDYLELHGLDTQTAMKAVIILSGGIIEGLLFDALVVSGKLTFETACQTTLKEMVGKALNQGIISEDRLTDAIRRHRNLIHPGREIKENIIFEESDAMLARIAVDIVIRDVRKWSLAEQQRRKLTNYLMKLNKEESELLQLFASPSPTDPDEFQHPFIRFAVYRAKDSLIKNGILIQNMGEELKENQEKISLVPDAIDLIGDLVIKSKVQRESIILDFKNIASSGAGGSGARPSR